MSSLEIKKIDNPLLSNQVLILAGFLFGLLSYSKAKLLETDSLTRYLLQPNLSNLTNNSYHLIDNKLGIDFIYGDLDQNTSLIQRIDFQNKTVKDATISSNLTKKVQLSANKTEEIQVMDKSSVLSVKKNLLSNPTNNHFNFDDYQFTHRKRRLPYSGFLNINVDCLNISDQFNKDINWSNRNRSIIKRANADEIKAEKKIKFTNINNSIHDIKSDNLTFVENSSLLQLKVNDNLKNKNNSHFLCKVKNLIDEKSIYNNLHEGSLKAFYRDDELENIAPDGQPPKDYEVPQFILRQNEGMKKSPYPPGYSVGRDCCNPEQAWADDVCVAKERLRIFMGFLLAAGVLITVIYYLWKTCFDERAQAHSRQIPNECPEAEEPQCLPNNEDKNG